MKFTVVWSIDEDARVDFVEAPCVDCDEFERALFQEYINDFIDGDVLDFSEGYPLWDLHAVFAGHIYPEY